MKFASFTILLALLSLRADAAIQATNLIATSTLTAGSTNTSAAYTVTGSLTMNAQTFWITHGTCGNGTNALTVGGYYQLSFDGGTTWITLAAFTPTLTNATTEAYTPSVSSIQPISRFQVFSSGTNVVTNVNVTVGFSL